MHLLVYALVQLQFERETFLNLNLKSFGAPNHVLKICESSVKFDAPLVKTLN